MSLSISVVIPSYKSAPWIEETIGSVLGQTYPLHGLELIIVDDASPDDTVGVARRMLQASPIKSQIIVREKNVGVAANRNAGWRAASGDWIQFLDHDDVLLPHKLQKQAECVSAAGEDVGVIYSTWRSLELIDGSWRPTGPVRASYLDEDTVAAMLKDDASGYVGPALFRKSALALVDGFEERPNLGEDTNLMLRMAMAGTKFRGTPERDAPAFLYRQTPGSLWKSYAKNPVALWNLMLTFRMAEEFLRQQRPGQDLPADVRRALASQYGRRVPLFLEHEPEKFQTAEAWLARLGYAVPPNLGPGMKAASKALGYRNAVRVRNKYRQVVETVKANERLKTLSATLRALRSP